MDHAASIKKRYLAKVLSEDGHDVLVLVQDLAVLEKRRSIRE